jgi:beta-glucanase (GH16 family)
MLERSSLIGTLLLAALAGCTDSSNAGQSGGAGGQGTGGAGGATADASDDAAGDAIDDAENSGNDVRVSIPGDDDDSPMSAPWIEVWRDDFRGPLGSSPDTSKWNFELTPHPANGELQYYTARRDNSYLDGSGHLVIQALFERYMGSSQPYTSARLNTHDHFDQMYGRFEARIKVPAGTGLWPAFWMLGSNIGDVGWPACGEFDIMEMAGSNPSINHASVHGTSAEKTGTYALPSGKLSDAFHLYALEWTPDHLTWFIDDVAYQTFTKAQLVPMGMSWGLDHPFYVLLNLAVGGSFDGPPGRGTTFPVQLFVDRVSIGRMPDADDASAPDAASDTSAEAGADAIGSDASDAAAPGE